jgi:hypothetical protein
MALTLADWAKRIDDDGKIAEIINLLSQTIGAGQKVSQFDR